MSRLWDGLSLILVVVGMAGCAPSQPQASPAPQVVKPPPVTQPSPPDSAPIVNGPARELSEARKHGWLAASQIINTLEQGDQEDFAGIDAWLADFRQATRGIDPQQDPASWASFDVDALVTKNPRYWQAHYEIAPGDPALIVLHAGLLLADSEPTRAAYVLLIGSQRPGIPQPVRDAMDQLRYAAIRAVEPANQAVLAGIKLHDQGHYDLALQKYEEALELCPACGFAHFEWGLTFREKQWRAAGIALPPPDKIGINDQRPNYAESTAAFAKARKHDPFQWKAYQGNDESVIGGLLPFLQKGMENWKKLTEAHPKLTDDLVLEELSEGLQAGQCHDLALVARQIVVARRGEYAPQDHPFFQTSLRKLAPGDVIEGVLEELAGEKKSVRQIIAPEKRQE